MEETKWLITSVNKNNLQDEKLRAKNDADIQKNQPSRFGIVNM
jgi:hypothetical protein